MSNLEPYKSNVSVPAGAAARARSRSIQLGIPLSRMANVIIALASETGGLPEPPPDLRGEVEGEGESFPFTLSGEIVSALKGKRRALDYVRWAIVEGLDKSPLAPPGD